MLGRTIIATLGVFSATLLASLYFQKHGDMPLNRGRQRQENLRKYGKPVLNSHLELTQNVDENSAIESRLAVHSRDDMGNLLEG